MGHFKFANGAKKIISIVLLMIICISTVTYAVTDADIKVIYDEIISNTNYITKLYEAGATQNMSNADVDVIIRNYVESTMNDAESQVNDGTIDKTNYQIKIKDLCISKLIDSPQFINLIDKAFPTAISDFFKKKVPVDMQPMYDTLKTKVPLALGLIEPTPSVEPEPTPSPTPEPPKPPKDTGGGTGSTGGGGTTIPIIVPVPSPVDTKIFNDLQSVDWAETAINTLAQAGVISKNTEMKFEPLNNVKREEFVKLLVSGFNLKNPNATSNFIDVDKNSWFYPYVSSMAMLGLAKGYDNNSFGAGQDITRQDIAVLLYRIIQYVKLDVTPSEPVSFKDDAKISDYAKNAVYIMRQMGIIKGTPENMFEPTSFATRAEAAQMIYNTYKIYIAKK